MRSDDTMVTQARSTRFDTPKPGDIIGFSGTGLVGIGINLGTYGTPFWSLNHVGIIGEYHGHAYLFESTTLADLPCVVQGRVTSGVQAVLLEDRIRIYRGKAWHYPLYRRLFEHERSRLNTFLIDHIGTPYDAIGAFRSAGVGLSWVESLLRPDDLSSLFCSELVAAAHAEVGLFATGHRSRWNPNRLVRAERRCGVLRRPSRLRWAAHHHSQPSTQ